MSLRIVGIASLILLVCAIAVETPAMAQTTGVRDVTASARSVIPLQTRLRYSTMIVLPDDEEILDVICGDKDFWVVTATQNMAHVKPAKEGASTNLNLVTTSGAVFSFLLTERNAGTPDLAVYVNGDPSVRRAKPKYVSTTQVDTLRDDLAAARAAVDAAKDRLVDEIDTYRRQYPTRLQFVYGTPPYKKPFLVRAVWHDGQFTYIKTDARELPALYELKDGAAALLNFQVVGGTYVVPKVVERGYLALGKQRFVFEER